MKSYSNAELLEFLNSLDFGIEGYVSLISPRGLGENLEKLNILENSGLVTLQGGNLTAITVKLTEKGKRFYRKS